MNYTKIKKISKGWSSYIWLVKDEKNKLFIRKEVREKSNRTNLGEREGQMLATANSVFVGPKLIKADIKNNFVIMQYIKGGKFLDFVISKKFDEISKKEIYEFLKELYYQCLKLDEIGLAHTQLQVGKNILVTNKNKKIFPVIIDFEKASIRTDGKSKNVGQIESFLFYNPHSFVAKRIREKLNLEL